MPDDIIEEQVAEQDTTVDDAVDESAAFGGEDDSDVVTGLEKETEPEPYKEPEKQEASEETTETEESEETETKEETEEVDEDLERGKALLAEQQRIENERKEKEAAEQKQDPDHYDFTKETLKKSDIELLHSVVPKDLFPDTPIEINGVTYDFKGMVKEYPELPVFVASIANNIVRQMAANGAIVAGDQYQSDVQKFQSGIEQRMFMRTLTHPQYGEPKAVEISKSDDFQNWYKEQPAEIQALGKSRDAWDHIKLIKRFQGKAILGKAKQAAAEKDMERQAKKEKFDAIHKTTVKSKSSKTRSKTPVDPVAEEREAFESEDDDLL